ncbi:hypothetical protein DdX_20093 [Ditylenchus destructor]|uniref:Uncharacterized protein n=1 Tax=Ditylenchus destructor TaxID=166010 RepID=A0AAD4QWI9_9BILA|nr:hypothetical protein DdX_20093 [Ditylenchus destructor]
MEMLMQNIYQALAIEQTSWRGRYKLSFRDLTTGERKVNVPNETVINRLPSQEFIDTNITQIRVPIKIQTDEHITTVGPTATSSLRLNHQIMSQTSSTYSTLLAGMTLDSKYNISSLLISHSHL